MVKSNSKLSKSIAFALISAALIIDEFLIFRTFQSTFGSSLAIFAIPTTLGGLSIGASVQILFYRRRLEPIILLILVLLIPGQLDVFMNPSVYIGLSFLVFCLFGYLYSYFYSLGENPIHIQAISLGASFLGVITLGLCSQWFGLPKVFFLDCTLLSISCFLLARNLTIRAVAVCTMLICITAGLFYQMPIPCKGRSLSDFQAVIKETLWSAHSRIDIASMRPVSRGLSKKFKGAGLNSIPLTVSCKGINANTLLSNYSSIPKDFTDVSSLKHELLFAPYVVLSPGADVLLVGVGGGRDILAAQEALNGIGSICAVENHREIIDYVKTAHSYSFKRLFQSASVDLHIEDARAYVAKTEKSYDFINFPIVILDATPKGQLSDSLMANYLYTRESISQFVQRTKPGGFLSFVFPGLNLDSNRFLSLIEEVQHSSNDNFEILIAAEDYFQMFLLKKGNFSEEEKGKLSSWLSAEGFSARWVKLGLAHKIESIANDDKPFYFLSQDDLNLISYSFSPIAMSLLACGLIVYSLAWKSLGNLKALIGPSIYFSLIGAVYVIHQMYFLAKLPIVLARPDLSVMIVLPAFLFFNAFGCLCSQYFPRIKLQMLFLIIAALDLLFFFWFDDLARLSLRHESSLRIAFSILCIAPHAILLGIPFAQGMKDLGQNKILIFSAFFFNGAATLLASIGNHLIVLHWGFSASLAAVALLTLLTAALSEVSRS